MVYSQGDTADVTTDLEKERSSWTIWGALNAITSVPIRGRPRQFDRERRGEDSVTLKAETAGPHAEDGGGP